MWGEDSSGRRISLLNREATSPSTSFARPKLPPIPAPPLPLSRRAPSSYTSTSSSVASSQDTYSRSARSSLSRSPAHTPPTPPLSRLNSYTSLKTKSISPMDSNYGFDPIDHQNKHPQHPYYTNLNKPQSYSSAQDASSQTPYYNLPGQHPLPAIDPLELDDFTQRSPLQRLPRQPNFSTDPILHQLSATSQFQQNPTLVSPTSNLSFNPTSKGMSRNGTHSIRPPQPIDTDSSAPVKSSSKKAPSDSPTANAPPKKKFPCPHAQTYQCVDTFTTSGHAARHGKKHTGEKNVTCPTCGKAFTRKDNMKQHERTHKGGRPGSASPSVTGSLRHNAGARSRRASSDAMSNGDAMDVDSAPLTPLASHHVNPPMLASKGERPGLRRSELSEILETVTTTTSGRDGSVVVKLEGREEEEEEGEGEVDGEGESPGLDALAMAAGTIA